jgi:hypothetical protein
MRLIWIGWISLLGACSSSPSQFGGAIDFSGVGGSVDAALHGPPQLNLDQGGLPPADLGTPGSGDLAVSPADLAVPSKVQSTLTFAGCGVDLSSDVVVVQNGVSMAVSRTTSPFSSLQLALGAQTGTVVLSSMQRIQTGMVVNAIAGSTWTNISSQTPDPISGTLVIHTYDQSAGIIDVEFHAARLQNPSDLSFCVVDGRIQTSGLSF